VVLISPWLFLFLILLFAAQPKEFFLDGLKKLEQRNHKCVEFRGEYVEQIFFLNPVACCFLYKAKDLSAPSYYYWESGFDSRKRQGIFIFTAPKPAQGPT
jgi:hypothetical protein